MNMSYCRFENTSNDVMDCIYAMASAQDVPELDLSKSEFEHFELMAERCKAYLLQYDRLTAATTVDQL